MGGNMGRRAKGDAQRIATREREDQALSLRKAGASYPEIARTLGYWGKGSAHKACHRAMARITLENARDLKLLELARLDATILECDQLVRANMKPATGPTVNGQYTGVGGSEAKARIVDRAQQRRMQAIELRGRLLGSFKIRHEHAGPGGTPIPVATAEVSLDEVLALADENAAGLEGT